MAVHGQGCQTGSDLGDQETQKGGRRPQIDQQKGHGQQQHDIPQKGDDQGVAAVAQRLEGGGQDDIHGGHGEGQGGQPQGGDAQGQSLRPGVKAYPQQGGGAQDEQPAANDPGTHCQEHAEADGPGYPAAVAGPVVEADDGDQAVVYTEDGHEHKA